MVKCTVDATLDQWLQAGGDVCVVREVPQDSKSVGQNGGDKQGPLPAIDSNADGEQLFRQVGSTVRNDSG